MTTRCPSPGCVARRRGLEIRLGFAWRRMLERTALCVRRTAPPAQVVVALLTARLRRRTAQLGRGFRSGEPGRARIHRATVRHCDIAAAYEAPRTARLGCLHEEGACT